MKTFKKEGYPDIRAEVGPQGEKILTKEGYMSDEAPQTPAKRKQEGLTNKDKQDLAANLQRYLKELRPDLSLQDLSKVACTFYVSILNQKKSSL